MSVITVPRYYENEYKIKESAPLFKNLGRKALVISGYTAYEKAGADLETALGLAGLDFSVEKISGYPTVEKAEALAGQIRKGNYDLVIAVGGGKIMDLSKSAADRAEVPVATIPTVPATCAAWSTLAVLYRDDGSQDIYHYTKNSPALILVDRQLLLEAPERYLRAGVADSIAKWYEVTSNFNHNESDFALRLQIKICDLILEFLEVDYLEAWLKDRENIPDEIRLNALDSIVLLAGLSGSISGRVPYGGLAHHFYNQATWEPETHINLHGEIVMYGLLVQFAIEGRPDEELKGRIRKMKSFGIPVTLAQLGFEKDADAAVRRIAHRISERVPDYAPAKTELSESVIADAIYKIDREGRAII